MSIAEPSPCYLCGATSASRCSRCAQAGLAVYFCSEAHQRLAWKLGHSKLCGKRMFEWPPISREEAAYLKTIAYLPDPQHGDTIAATLRINGIHASAEVVLDRLVDGT
ncbi:hypothetical protein JCM10207_001665 [Rhodosporidiobolus poonsookiae]